MRRVVDKDAMEEEFQNPAAVRQPSRNRGLLRIIALAALAAFLLGAALTLYLAKAGTLDFLFGKDAETAVAVAGSSEALLAQPSPVPSAGEARAAAKAAKAVEKVAQQQGGLEARVVAMEQRLDSLSLQAQAVAGNAARAEGLLIAFAARRAIERGSKLDNLASQLKLRFGDAQPRAVNTVIAASEHPVTLDMLIARLDGLGHKLSNEAQEQVSWSWFKQQLGELFVVRRETAPSPQPEKRLERARLFLETGRIRAAVDEVRNLPGADSQDAQRWLADATRFGDAQDALELLETTALFDQSELRDSQGNRVQQPSPVKKQ